MNKITTIAIIAAGTAAAATQADVSTAVITADNHYALYTSTGGSVSYIGGNELGAGGSNGGYNWSEAETHSFTAGDTIYIAAWSDDSVAQGVLAQLTVPGYGLILSGDARWEVYATDINMGDGDPHPLSSTIAGYAAYASGNGLWNAVFSGGSNGVQPWSTIAGIDAEATWMWHNVAGVNDPTQGGSGAGEMLLFRITVPTPGSFAVLGLGGLAATRRRRR